MVPNKLSPEEVVQEWSDARFDEAAGMPSAAQRAQVIARMELRLEQTVVEVSSSRQRARLYGALGCAAALCAAAFGVWHWNRSRLLSHDPGASGVARVESVQGSVSVARPGIAATPVTGDTTLSPGDDVVTAPNGRTRVELADGVSLTLGEASRLSLSKPNLGQGPQLAQAHEQIRLDEGIVTVKVPHLSPGRSFAVKTPDAEVTVHGTAFSVEVGQFVSADLPLRSGASAGDASLTTRVRVTEGVVSVASAGREVFIRAGMQWISPHAEPTSHRMADSPTPSAGGAAPSTSIFTPAPAPPKPPSSSLAEQTRLLETGASSARSGDQRTAIASFNELLRRYPASPLAHEARVQLFRSLAAAQDYAGAAREARRYLAAYPEGPAREEAKKLALDH